MNELIFVLLVSLERNISIYCSEQKSSFLSLLYIMIQREGKWIKISGKYSMIRRHYLKKTKLDSFHSLSLLSSHNQQKKHHIMLRTLRFDF